jgi:hypothetical protein
VLLAAACLGFANVQTFGVAALLFGLLLGLGWGVFTPWARSSWQ